MIPGGPRPCRRPGRGRRARPALIALLLAAALGAGSARAGPTGHVRGKVHSLEDEGQAAEGARVTLRSPRILGGPLVTRTDEEGRFRFGELRPGTYDLRVEQEGFLPRVETGVRVEIDSIVFREYALTPETEENQGGVDETEASEEGVHPRRVALGRSIRPALTDKIVTPRTPTGMALLVPGVVEDYYRPQSPAIHGVGARSQARWLDGFYVTDPSRRLENGLVNFDSIIETLVLTGGLDAEYGYAAGSLIHTVTSPGQDTFEFDGSLYWAPSPLRLADDGERTLVNGLAGNLSASGPILPGRLWFYTSIAGSDVTRTTPLQDPVFLETPFMAPQQDRDVYMLGKLTWKPLAWQTFGLLLQSEPGWLTNAQQQPLRHPRAESQLYTGGLKAGFTSETRLFEHVTWRTLLSYSIDQEEVTPVSGDIGLAGHRNLATGTSTINASRLTDNYRSRLQIDSSVSTWLTGFLGQHLVKFGVQGQVSWNAVEEGLTGGELFLDRGLTEPGTDLSGVGDPFRVQRADTPLTKFVWGNIVSAYLQDVWNPFDNVTVRAGLRFDSARAFIDTADGGNLLYNFNWPSPRIGMSWDPFGDGKTAIRGGYYHYADVGDLSLPARVGRTLELETYELNPATGKYDIFVGREGGNARVLPGSALIPPTMHELILGASREVFGDASVHVDLIYRHRQNLFEDTESNVQWNPEGSDATGFGNGRAEPVRTLQTPANAVQRYIGLDVAFDKRLSDRWSLFASYTLARLEGSVEGGVGYAFDNPRQAAYEFGFLRNDIRHNARVFLTYDLPYGVTLGVSAQYQSGRPYSKLFKNDYYDDYVDRRAPRGYDPGDLDDPDDDVELRLPDQFLVNARLSWRLKELTNQDIWLLLDVRNVLNQRPTIAVEERALPPDAATFFGQSLERVDPLGATLGLRYRF